MAGQEIELKPRLPEPVTTRPLKTGAAFTLVLPRKRFVYRHWDKEKYLPGEEAQLILEGEGIGEGPYEFRIESSDDKQGKSWREVATLKATVEGDKASAKFKLPKAPPRGRITKAEWRRTFAKPGDRIGLHVEAEGYEGALLDLRVERKNPQTGEWETYASWRGEIEDGKYEGVFPAPPVKRERPLVAGEIVALRWIDKPQENAAVWMEATLRNLDGTALEFFLERSDAEGNWVQIGKAISTVRGSAAKNSVLVPPLPEGAQPPSPVHFSKCAFHGGEDLVVSVDPKWLDGKAFEVKLERRQLRQGSSWEEIAQIKGRRGHGKAEE